MKKENKKILKAAAKNIGSEEHSEMAISALADELTFHMDILGLNSITLSRGPDEDDSTEDECHDDECTDDECDIYSEPEESIQNLIDVIDAQITKQLSKLSL